MKPDSGWPSELLVLRLKKSRRTFYAQIERRSFCTASVESGQLGDLDKAGLATLPRLGPGHHHVDVAAAASGADEPLSPLGNGGLGPVLFGRLGGIGLDLVTARLAPHDQPNASGSRVAERHRRTGW